MKRNGVWQWVWCWLSVLVAGCAARGGSGTSIPLSTLPLATLPRPLPTLLPFTPIWRVIRPTASSATHTATEDSPAPQLTLTRALTPLVPFGMIPLPALTLEPLACYPAHPNGWWCLGAIHNTLNVPCVGITVQIVLLDLKNLPFMMLTVPAARTLIRPGEETPYGALFRDAPELIGGATVALVGGLSIAVPDAGTIPTVALPVSGLTYGVDGLVHGTITNASAQSVTFDTLATLFDANDHVVGYREIDDPNRLSSGASRSIAVAVTSLATAVPVARVGLTADGSAADQ